MATSQPPLSPPKHLEEDEQNPGETSTNNTSEKIQALFPGLQNFEAQDTDILVATSMKSGTTWLKALTFCILNRKLYPDSQQHPLHTSNPHILVPFLELKLYTEKEQFTVEKTFGIHITNPQEPQQVDSASKHGILLEVIT
ncbi:unnamed protein product [Ilex paraguariensis]|uniref:Sulfotransferase n=1 Tax=Ilex paraguariensis TaxID=185542 RepID=A0ABC8RCQ7_9AQUA